ncbi:MAG: sugar ABC transporter permease, partial [Nitrospinota bacterium]
MEAAVERPARAPAIPAPTFLGRLSDSERVLAPLMIAPAILYIAVLVGLPFLLAISYSLSDATTGDPSL